MNEALEDWLNYGDFAAGIGTNRLPRTAAMVRPEWAGEASIMRA